MICASFSMFSQVLACGFPHLSQQVRQGRSFRRQLIFDMAEAEVGGSQGWTTCYESKCKNLEHLCSLGDMLHDMLAKSSKSNSFKLCWTILYRAEPILYGMVSFLNRVILLWIWFEHGMNPHQIAEPLFAPTGQAVLNRNLHSAAGQRKLSPEEEYARKDPSALQILAVMIFDWAMLSYVELVLNSMSHSSRVRSSH